MRNTLGSEAYGDFAFLPSRYERNDLEAAKEPWLKGIASGRPVQDFDAILISCAYALELVNLPLLLIKSGIPLRASERDSSWPLILVGGSNGLANQGLIFSNGDSFADGLYFGEAEANPGGAELFTILAAQRGWEKDALVTELEQHIPSFWASGHSLDPADPTFRRVHSARSISSMKPFLPTRYPILNSPEANTGRLQISWGCPSFCTFCFEGWERKPYREVSHTDAVDMAIQLLRNTGISTLELYSFNFNAHSDILSLLLDLNRIFDRVNMMSQRADILVNTPGMLECELAAEKRSFTIGVEGISEGMRALYAKGLSSKDLWFLIERLFKAKVREIKFFYILSGVETEQDLTEFNQFCERLKNLADQIRPSPRLLFSAGYLVRMPFTPLRYGALEFDETKLEDISHRVKIAVESAGFEFRLAMDWDEYVADQLLVLGGYGLANGLESAAQKGVIYDQGIRGDLVSPLIQALLQDGSLEKTPDRIRGTLSEEKSMAYSFPFSFVQTSVTESFLYKAYQEAMERREPATCFGASGKESRCMGCGACADHQERTFLTEHSIDGDPTQKKAQELANLIRKKRRMQGRYIKVTLGKTFAGAYTEYLSALLLKSVLTQKPELTGRLFRISEAMWTSPDWKDRIGWGVCGETVLALYGLNPDSSEETPPALSDNDLAAVLDALSELNPIPLGNEPIVYYPQYIDITFSDLGSTEALKACREWLTSLKVAFTEKKGSGSLQRIFEIAPKDKKKRILTEAALYWDEAERRTWLEITGGPKLSLSYFMPRENDRFSVSVYIKQLSTGLS
ncbi:radical SAM protein [Gracilinema caldarium]|uniref:radical SAM protein n=1 Tax=Gracilinema caldarium TaxID=215591 RepID=UPI0026EFEE04|nr:radical SAM protein [Gracilinema caldarium]